MTNVELEVRKAYLRKTKERIKRLKERGFNGEHDSKVFTQLRRLGNTPEERLRVDKYLSLAEKTVDYYDTPSEEVKPQINDVFHAVWSDLKQRQNAGM